MSQDDSIERQQKIDNLFAMSQALLQDVRGIGEDIPGIGVLTVEGVQNKFRGYLLSGVSDLDKEDGKNLADLENSEQQNFLGFIKKTIEGESNSLNLTQDEIQRLIDTISGEVVQVQNIVKNSGQEVAAQAQQMQQQQKQQVREQRNQQQMQQQQHQAHQQMQQQQQSQQQQMQNAPKPLYLGPVADQHIQSIRAGIGKPLEDGTTLSPGRAGELIAGYIHSMPMLPADKNAPNYQQLLEEYNAAVRAGRPVREEAPERLYREHSEKDPRTFEVNFNEMASPSDGSEPFNKNLYLPRMKDGEPVRAQDGSVIQDFITFENGKPVDVYMPPPPNETALDPASVAHLKSLGIMEGQEQDLAQGQGQEQDLAQSQGQSQVPEGQAPEGQEIEDTPKMGPGAVDPSKNLAAERAAAGHTHQDVGDVGGQPPKKPPKPTPPPEPPMSPNSQGPEGWQGVEPIANRAYGNPPGVDESTGRSTEALEYVEIDHREPGDGGYITVEGPEAQHIYESAEDVYPIKEEALGSEKKSGQVPQSEESPYMEMRSPKGGESHYQRPSNEPAGGDPLYDTPDGRRVSADKVEKGSVLSERDQEYPDLEEINASWKAWKVKGAGAAPGKQESVEAGKKAKGKENEEPNLGEAVRGIKDALEAENEKQLKSATPGKDVGEKSKQTRTRRGSDDDKFPGI